MTSCPELKRESGHHAVSLITIGLLIFLLMCSLPAAGMKVTGTRYAGSISAGSSAVHTMTISINPDDPPMDLIVDVLGFGQTPQQGSSGIPPEKDTSPYSARTFITVSPKTFHLQPGGSQVVQATIAVPRDVGDGGRYAVLTIRNAPIGNGTTAIVTSISVPVLVTIAGSAPSQTGTITSLDVADIVPGQPIRITTGVKNTGNIHYAVKNTVTVTDSAGNPVVTGVSDASNRSVIPTFTINYEVNLDKALPAGKYTVSSQISLQDGTVLDTKTTTFEVQANYIPPLQGAIIKLTARNGGVLTTPDGRVSIDFPAGAVFSDTDVSLKPVTKDQVPTPSGGMVPASTSFKVDGINGLLAKEATLTVKYTSADLEAAKSDVSKLVLARYDDAESKWTILPTTLDKSALTLSTPVNRFSTWAVMVSGGGNTQVSAGNTAAASQIGGSRPTGLGLDLMVVIGALGLIISCFSISRSRKK
jgi:hypothetical protein